MDASHAVPLLVWFAIVVVLLHFLMTGSLSMVSGYLHYRFVWTCGSLCMILVSLTLIGCSTLVWCAVQLLVIGSIAWTSESLWLYCFSSVGSLAILFHQTFPVQTYTWFVVA